MAGCRGRCHRSRWQLTCPLSAGSIGVPGPLARRQSAVQRDHRLCQQHPARSAARLPGRSGHGVAHPHDQSLERDGHRGSPQQEVVGVRRAYRLLRLVGGHVRHRSEPLLASTERRARRRPGVLSGACGARDLRPILHGGAHQPGAARQLPLGGGRQRAEFPIRTPGSCPTTGPSRPCRWASAR